MDANLRILKSIQKINDNIKEQANKEQQDIKQVNETIEQVQSGIETYKDDTINKQKEYESEQNTIKEQQDEMTKRQGQIESNITAIKSQIKADKDQANRNIQDVKEMVTNIELKVPKDGKDGIDGKDGKDGRDGKDGKDGQDGIDGVGISNVEINEGGELIIHFTNGATKNVGRVVGHNGVGFRGPNGIGIKDIEIKDEHLFVTLTDGNVIDAGSIHGGTITETDPIFTNSPSYGITNEDITSWNNKSEFSGDYDDLENKPSDISAFNNDVGYVTQDKFFYIQIANDNTTTTIWSDLYEAYSNNALITAKIDYVEGVATIPVVVPLYSIIGTQSGGSLVFTFVMGTSTITYIVTGTGDNVCSVIKQVSNFELNSNKTNSITSNKSSTTLYPCTKAVYDEFQRKPVLIYDKVGKLHVQGTITSGTDGDNGLLNQNQGEGTNRKVTSWNITGMDLSPFKRIRVVYSRNDETSAVTGDFFIPLDADYITNNDLNIYVNGASLPYYAVRSRLVGINCAISSDKTSFSVTQTISLTATTLGMVATTVNDMFVTKIEGYYE